MVMGNGESGQTPLVAFGRDSPLDNLLDKLLAASGTVSVARAWAADERCVRYLVRHGPVGWCSASRVWTSARFVLNSRQNRLYG